MADRLILYGHPFSSYCWKVLIPLWENGVSFDYRRLDDPANGEVWSRTSPFKRMPLLVDGSHVIAEATIIIEYLQLHHPGTTPMIPLEPIVALEARMLDRFSDNYLMGPTQTVVAESLRDPANRDPAGVEQAHTLLETAYGWWNGHMQDRQWALATFGLADCAAAPALFYADWVHPISAAFPALRAYRARLLSRPTVARAVREARPFRSGFPLGDPGRD